MRSSRFLSRCRLVKAQPLFTAHAAGVLPHDVAVLATASFHLGGDDVLAVVRVLDVLEILLDRVYGNHAALLIGAMVRLSVASAVPTPAEDAVIPLRLAACGDCHLEQLIVRCLLVLDNDWNHPTLTSPAMTLILPLTLPHFTSPL